MQKLMSTKSCAVLYNNITRQISFSIDNLGVNEILLEKFILFNSFYDWKWMLLKKFSRYSRVLKIAYSYRRLPHPKNGAEENFLSVCAFFIRSLMYIKNVQVSIIMKNGESNSWFCPFSIQNRWLMHLLFWNEGS